MDATAYQFVGFSLPNIQYVSQQVFFSVGRVSFLISLNYLSTEIRVLSWQLGQGVQSIPESSMQYANDNALLLAKSLRGALLVLFFSSGILSAFASVGLVLLGRELSSKSKSKDP